MTAIREGVYNGVQIATREVFQLFLYNRGHLNTLERKKEMDLGNIPVLRRAMVPMLLPTLHLVMRFLIFPVGHCRTADNGCGRNGKATMVRSRHLYGDPWPYLNAELMNDSFE